MLFTVAFYHFLFLRYLDLTKRPISSDILAPFPDWNNLYRYIYIYMYVYIICYILYIYFLILYYIIYSYGLSWQWSYLLSSITWKRFRDDIFVACEYRTDALRSILDYLNDVDEAGKIKFTMEIADQEKGLEFLDLKIKCVEIKLSVDTCLCKTYKKFYLCKATYMLFT